MSFVKLWTLGLKAFKSAGSWLLLMLIAAYRMLGTTHLGGACRFTPSCSEYAVDVARSHSFFPAVYLITKRILKCRPGGTYGLDPVPLASGDLHARSK